MFRRCALLGVLVLLATIPDPLAKPFMDVEPAARLCGIGRSHAYDLVRRGEFIVPVVRFGRRVKVPTRALLVALGLLDEVRP